jgi:amino acid adenylation domain-containing protein
MTVISAASPLVALVLADDLAGANQTALGMAGARVSYGELKREVLAIAEWLRRVGVGEGDPVAFVLPKSIAAVEILLGVLAAGAAYVPLNYRLPALALKAILRDLNPRLVIAEPPQAEMLLRDNDLTGLSVASTGSGACAGLKLRRAASGPVSQPAAADDLAAILYTSGSTGEPKGIMLSHRNIHSFVEWAAETFRISSTDNVANHAPLHFDLSVFDIFATLARHGTVHLIDEAAAQFPGAVRAIIDSAHISVWYSVPTALMRLQERHALKGASSLRLVLFAGEVFPVPALRRLMADLPQPEYANLYGPTETNVCTYYRLPTAPASDSETLPIGRPCEHLDVSVRDCAGELVPPGETGEICVAGPAVMAGYWRRPEATRAARLAGREDSYRTGDYGYARADGLYMLTGRRDQQAKLRGHRIELLALEAALNAHPGVHEAVALVLPDERTGGELLVYAVARGEPLPLSEIRNFVDARLAPSYRPDRIEWLSEVPRTANGKCDRILLRSRAEQNRKA